MRMRIPHCLFDTFSVYYVTMAGLTDRPLLLPDYNWFLLNIPFFMQDFMNSMKDFRKSSKIAAFSMINRRTFF